MPRREPTPHVDVDAVRASAFTLSDEVAPFVSEWHAHRKHQLLYSASGTLRLEVDEAMWLLPPQRAAFIRAHVSHRVRSEQATSLRTIYFSERAVPEAPDERCNVFAVTPLARELIVHSVRWDASRSPSDPVAQAYFAAIIALLPEWTRSALALSLPTAKTPELALAMAYVQSRLNRPIALADAAKAAGLSSRTLARRFEGETQLGFRQFLRQARLLRAMELLSVPGARVGEVAAECGFDSMAAFTHAFTAVIGERPKVFRARVASG